MKLTKYFILIIVMLVVLSLWLTVGRAADQTSLPQQEYVLAISSDGQIVDFRSIVANSPEKYGDPTDPERFIPPYNPESATNMEILRIIGDDDRFQIHDTTLFPWKTVVKISGIWGDGIGFSCSGWMLSTSTVVTAGHCVYDYNRSKTFATQVTVIPALNSDDSPSEPFDRCLVVRGWVPDTWINDGGMGDDYGVYDLMCRVGNQTGNPGYRVVAENPVGIHEYVYGYPGDMGGTTLWGGGGDIVDAWSDILFYDNDTAGGQSGGPVWHSHTTCGWPCVIGINTGEFDPPTPNNGVRITQEVFDFLLVRREFVFHGVYLPLVLKEQGQSSAMSSPEYNNPYPAPSDETIPVEPSSGAQPLPYP